MHALERLAVNVRLASAWGRALPALVKARPGAAYTVADAFAESVARAPRHPALVFGDQELSYAELDRASNRVARWAQAQGLRRGDVVALLMENRPEFVVHWLGLAKVGVVSALINTNLTGRPLAHSLSVSGARDLILEAALAENWAGAVDQLDEAPRVWATCGEVADAEDLDADVAQRSASPLDANVRSGLTSSDKLFYIYTSGTTGLPKAANFSHLRFIASAQGGRAMGQIGPNDRMYVVLPLYHSAGGVMALGSALLSGATAVLARKFSASRFWEDCVRHDVTTFQYIGELCRYLLNSPPHPDERKHRIRLCIGNGLRPEIWKPFQDRFGIPQILEFYGATEGNVVFMNVDNKVGSIGRMPGLMRRAAGMYLVRFDVQKEEVVRGRDGFCIECGIDEPGEAIGQITGAVTFEGYSDEAATEKKLLRNVFKKGDTFFRTGDLLRRDADDYFYFVDRIGDTFRWKGENVSTSEVAEVVGTCPGVKEANVYGVAVPGTDGRAGMASLVVDDDFDVDKLREEVETHLAPYARPLFLRILPEIEITGTFKHRKVDAVKEGFDPARISDPLYFLDPEKGRYVPLDGGIHERIHAGSFRL
ncbi:MAG: long-chain-acyl-CoA synthetase [Myxococcales bacterium]|nr:long-chain-acyl-CoA synthetase [Myxococcales bacterium]